VRAFPCVDAGLGRLDRDHLRRRPRQSQRVARMADRNRLPVHYRPLLGARTAGMAPSRSFAVARSDAFPVECSPGQRFVVASSGYWYRFCSCPAVPCGLPEQSPRSQAAHTCCPYRKSNPDVLMVQTSECRSFGRFALQDVELMAQDKDLRLKPRPRSEEPGQPACQQLEKIDHRARTSPDSPSAR
jgi:hypothetical protein